MTQNQIRAHALQPGNVTTGTGETIVRVSIGISTPKGKVDVVLQKQDGSYRFAIWGKHTLIGVKANG